MRFLLLGALELHGPNGPLRLPSTMQRTLLAVLLINQGRCVSLDRLVSELWPEDPPKTARKTLHGYAWRLRERLADPDARELVTQENGYLLATDPGQIDAVRFERAALSGIAMLSEGRMGEGLTRLVEALALWRGPALDNVLRTPAVVAYEAWLEELRISALECRLSAEVAFGCHISVLAQLRSLVIQQPLQERFHELLMYGLCFSGREAEALRVYQEAADVLEAELGVRPGASLQRLHHQISECQRIGPVPRGRPPARWDRVLETGDRP